MLQESGAAYMCGAGYAQQWTKCNENLHMLSSLCMGKLWAS